MFRSLEINNKKNKNKMGVSASARASYIILTMLVVWVKVKRVGAVVPLPVGRGSKPSAVEPWSLGAGKKAGHSDDVLA